MGIGNLLRLLLSAYEAVLLARIIFSWIPYRGGENKFVSDLREFSFKATEPLLAPIRNLLSKTPLGNTMLDFSPIALFLLIGIIRNFTLFLR